METQQINDINSTYVPDNELKLNIENIAWIEASRAYRKLHHNHHEDNQNPGIMDVNYLTISTQYLLEIMTRSRTSLIALTPLAKSLDGLFEHYEAHFRRTTTTCRKIITKDQGYAVSRLKSERRQEEEEEENRSPVYEYLEIMTQTLEQTRICLDQQISTLNRLSIEHSKATEKLKEKE